MKLKAYLEEVNKLTKLFPDILDFDVIFTTYDSGRFSEHIVDDVKGVWYYSVEGKLLKAVCIN